MLNCNKFFLIHQLLCKAQQNGYLDRKWNKIIVFMLGMNLARKHDGVRVSWHMCNEPSRSTAFTLFGSRSEEEKMQGQRGGSRGNLGM